VSKIETGRFSDLLRRYLGMKGVSVVSSELSPELSPILVLESERPEWEFLKNEKLMASVFAQGGVVGQNTLYRLRNPAGSGVVAVITRFMITTDLTEIVIAERDDDNGNLATVLPTVSRDTRLPVLNASSLIASQANNVVVTGESWWTARLLANSDAPQDVQFVLTAGHEIDLVQLGANVAIRGWVHWRERRLDVLEAQ